MTTIPTTPSTSAFAEASQIIGSLNALIATLNGSLSGQLAALPAPLTTSGVAANTVLQATNVVLASGQAVRVKVFGSNSADVNAKTVTVNFGAAGTMALAVTGSGANWWVEGLIQNVGTVTSPVWRGVLFGAQGATLIAPAVASGSDAVTTPQTLSITATAAVAGTMTVNGAWLEYVR